MQVTPSPPAPDAWLRFMPSSTGELLGAGACLAACLFVCEPTWVQQPAARHLAAAGTTAATWIAAAAVDDAAAATACCPAPTLARTASALPGTRCRDLGLARTYALVNPRRTSTAVVNCPRSIKVLIKPNCWVQVHQEDGYVLRQVYYAPGEPNKWQGEFVFVRDSVGEQATWPGRGGPPPQLPDVREGCVDRDDRKVRVGYWLSTLDGWGT